MKVLSVKQPFASFICSGVKDVENRTWKTEYRGKILIHASGEAWAWPSTCQLPEKFVYKLENQILGKGTQEYFDLLDKAYDFYGKKWDSVDDPNLWLKDEIKKCGYFCVSQAIIGEVKLLDIVKNYDSDFSDKECYNWIIGEPILYEKPITNVIGKLRLWDYEVKL